MKIGGLQKCSLIDYPKEICAIVFTYGCNLRCPYCHNPELVTGKPPLIGMEELFEFLHNRTRRLTAVTITGGEPTLHEDLAEFMERIKSLGFKVKLDTNGTKPEMLEELIERRLLDYIAMDIKAPLEKYETVCRVKNINTKHITRSIRMIQSSGIKYEFRTTMVRELLSPSDIETIVNEISGTDTYVLQRFVPSKTLDSNFMKAHTFSESEISRLKKRLQNRVKKLIVR